MTYEETIDYLYQQLPVFHRIGKKAFKANLNNTIAICNHLDNPQQKFKTIHVAGTNGKGSTSHYLAAIFQAAGFKTGLYTSPHLKSFTERIKINGEEIPKDKVVDFVENNRSFLEDLKPSFFEMSVGMAFNYFAQESVDIAIIEVGLGGRLDSTNIISPEISVITNISFDHTDILGDTLPKIATEKAGIIKNEVPVVISERQPETEKVFIEKSLLEKADIFFAEDYFKILQFNAEQDFLAVDILNLSNNQRFQLKSQLLGSYQLKNILGVLKVVEVLNTKGYSIDFKAIEEGISQVISLTNLKGRWQKISNQPLIICDTAHNISGITQILENLSKLTYGKLWMILGFVSDKDISGALALLPQNANYVFCQASIPRAFDAFRLKILAETFCLVGEVLVDVNEAIDYVKGKMGEDDLLYIGGSTFVVAEINGL